MQNIANPYALQIEDLALMCLEQGLGQAEQHCTPKSD
jgi:hypothetical protein